VSRVMCHVSCVTCHMSCMCHVCVIPIPVHVAYICDAHGTWHPGMQVDGHSIQSGKEESDRGKSQEL
jgi:hypothetical protein